VAVSGFAASSGVIPACLKRPCHSSGKDVNSNPPVVLLNPICVWCLKLVGPPSSNAGGGCMEKVRSLAARELTASDDSAHLRTMLIKIESICTF